MTATLKKIQKTNPEVTFEKVNDFYKFEKLWADESIGFKLEKGVKTTVLLEIRFLPEIIGLYHLKSDCIEFIYSPRKKSDPLLKRNFKFNYDGQSLTCSFEKCSKAVEFLARRLRILSSDTNSDYRNLRDFRSYFSKTAPSHVKDFYKDRIPISFWVKGPIKKFKKDLIPLFKTINFYINFFERSHPTIVILNPKQNSLKIKRPCYTDKNVFPSTIQGKRLNQTILDIFEVANSTTDLRLRFIFYFQIVEYCTYYFLETDIKEKLQSILCQPDITDKSNLYSKEIQDLLQNNFYTNRSDSSKLEKSIFHFISIEDIKYEIDCNVDHFTKDIKFEGGLVIKKIFDKKEQANHMNNSTLKSIKENVEKIRNTIVHLRHSRENTVILPTPKNNELITPYLYVLRRIAEKIAIKFE